MALEAALRLCSLGAVLATPRCGPPGSARRSVTASSVCLSWHVRQPNPTAAGRRWQAAIPFGAAAW